MLTLSLKKKKNHNKKPHGSLFSSQAPQSHARVTHHSHALQPCSIPRNLGFPQSTAATSHTQSSGDLQTLSDPPQTCSSLYIPSPTSGALSWDSVSFQGTMPWNGFSSLLSLLWPSLHLPELPGCHHCEIRVGHFAVPAALWCQAPTCPFPALPTLPCHSPNKPVTPASPPAVTMDSIIHSCPAPALHPKVQPCCNPF